MSTPTICRTIGHLIKDIHFPSSLFLLDPVRIFAIVPLRQLVVTDGSPADSCNRTGESRRKPSCSRERDSREQSNQRDKLREAAAKCIDSGKVKIFHRR